MRARASARWIFIYVRAWAERGFLKVLRGAAPRRKRAGPRLAAAAGRGHALGRRLACSVREEHVGAQRTLKWPAEGFGSAAAPPLPAAGQWRPLRRGPTLVGREGGSVRGLAQMGTGSGASTFRLGCCLVPAMPSGGETTLLSGCAAGAGGRFCCADEERRRGRATSAQLAGNTQVAFERGGGGGGGHCRGCFRSNVLAGGSVRWPTE